MSYLMTLRDGTTFELDSHGAVLARSDGPDGWDYSGKWIIVGFKRRAHSAATITLAEAADGADTGQGWVLDNDHGTLRLWGSPSGRKLATITHGQPMPNDVIPDPDGVPVTVVASCYYNDEDPEATHLVLLLYPRSPFFRVAILNDRWRFHDASERILNIVPAVRDTYQHWGGDY